MTCLSRSSSFAATGETTILDEVNLGWGELTKEKRDNFL